jgi:hypothetical protein
MISPDFKGVARGALTTPALLSQRERRENRGGSDCVPSLPPGERARVCEVS